MAILKEKVGMKVVVPYERNSCAVKWAFVCVCFVRIVCLFLHLAVTAFSLSGNRVHHILLMFSVLKHKLP